MLNSSFYKRYVDDRFGNLNEKNLSFISFYTLDRFWLKDEFKGVLENVPWHT